MRNNLKNISNTFIKIVIAIILLFSLSANAQEKVRIMSYNILEYPNSTTNDSILVADTTARNHYYKTIISSVNPDIFIAVEIIRRVDAEGFLKNVMNSFGESYSMTYGETYTDDNAVYFKTDKFDVIDSTIVIVQSGGHSTSLFTLYDKQTRDTLKIFAVHFFSSESETEEREYAANAIRLYSDAFSNGTYFIAMGDYNTYGGTEPGFTALLDQTNDGYFIDPLNLQNLSNWSNDTLTEYNTFCTRMDAGDYLGGGENDGLDERFDILLNSQTVVDSGGITYVQGSFVNYGNDGLHNNININDNGSTDLPNQAVSQTIADALYMVSDHLPIYADFNFGSPSSGGIAFTQVGSTNPDIIEFITLYDHTDLTKLKITDSEVDDHGDLVNGNGTYDLSNTPWKDVPGGTFVRLGSSLTNDNDPSDRLLVYNGTGSGSLPALDDGTYGYQLIAYTGSSDAPYYIAGITWGNDGWSSSPSQSYAPATISDIALGGGSNYYFSGTVNGDADATRDALTNPANWTSYGGTTYNDLTSSIGNGALPVELSFFTGSLNGNEVQLRWKTETELNNYGFEIERSNDNSKWHVISFIDGSGNSNSPKNYQYLDSNISGSGNYFYRLKQIDNDGTYKYSNVVSVVAHAPEQYFLSQNYPNPFNPETRIDFSLPVTQFVSLKVYNVLGELVKELVNEKKDAGSYTVMFNASDLSSGIYIYRLETQNFVINKKMTLLK